MRARDIPTGCVIDGSHMRSDDFDLAIIDLAVRCGYRSEPIGDDLSDVDRWEAISWEADRACDWLGDRLAPARYVTVYDSCLLVEEFWEGGE